MTLNSIHQELLEKHIETLEFLRLTEIADAAYEKRKPKVAFVEPTDWIYLESLRFCKNHLR